MNRKVSSKRNPFAFSLGGFTAIGWALAPQAIADDRINQAYDARMRQAASNRSGEEIARDRAPEREAGLCPTHFEQAPCFCDAA